MELLVFLGPVLGDSHVPVGLILQALLPVLMGLAAVAGYIFILDLNYVLFILVDDTEQFAFDPRVVLCDVVLAEEGELLLQEEV